MKSVKNYLPISKRTRGRGGKSKTTDFTDLTDQLIRNSHGDRQGILIQRESVAKIRRADEGGLRYPMGTKSIEDFCHAC